MSLESEVAALKIAVDTLTNVAQTLDTSTQSAYNTAVATATTKAGEAAAQVTLAAAQAQSAAIEVAIALDYKTAAAASAASAAAAQLAAQGYASTAQATNPDSPIRINPRKITADFAVGSEYNASSAGPIAISEGVTVTIEDNATWSIH